MIENGVWSAEKVQQFREADADGYIGMRGYLNYFQDAAASYMHEYGWGNDTVHERYGVAWVYTKYRMRVEERTAYDAPLRMACWIEKNKKLAAVTHAVEITKNGRRLAEGRLESCLVSLTDRRIARLTAIGYDKDTHAIERSTQTGDFSRISPETAGMEEAYRYTVRYSDLDNNRHMTNLRYIPLLQDAFAPEEFDGRYLCDLEIHYRNQCLYGEELRILRAAETDEPDRAESAQKSPRDTWRVTAVKADGTVAVCARMTFAREHRAEGGDDGTV